MQLPLAACWLSQTHCSSGKTLLLQLFLHHMGRFPDALPICKENWCFCLLLPLLFIAISLPQTPILPRSFSTSVYQYCYKGCYPWLTVFIISFKHFTSSLFPTIPQVKLLDFAFNILSGLYPDVHYQKSAPEFRKSLNAA